MKVGICFRSSSFNFVLIFAVTLRRQSLKGCVNMKYQGQLVGSCSVAISCSSHRIQITCIANTLEVCFFPFMWFPSFKRKLGFSLLRSTGSAAESTVSTEKMGPQKRIVEESWPPILEDPRSTKFRRIYHPRPIFNVPSLCHHRGSLYPKFCFLYVHPCR